MKSIGKLEDISFQELSALWDKNENDFYEYGSEAWRLAERAINELQRNKNADAYVMIDDATDEMISICAYERASMDRGITYFGYSLCDSSKELLIGDEPIIRANEFILVHDIAGRGKNAAYSTMKDIMQMAEFEGRAVIFEALPKATGFYEKLGIFYLQKQDEEDCGNEEIIMIWEP